jgi:hypothetical protein
VAGGLNRNQQADLYQRLSSNLVPRGNKPVRLNSSLLREMWRCASSLELLPNGVKADLGELLVKKVRTKEHSASDLWCLSRLGARQLFYGPNNQVLSAAIAARWVEALVKAGNSEEAVLAIARVTGDAARDLPPGTVEMVRRALGDDRLIAILEGEERDWAALGRVFGEDLPSGLVLKAAE